MYWKSVRVISIVVLLFSLSVSIVSAYNLNPWSWPKQFGQTYTVYVKYDTSDAYIRASWDTAVSDWNSEQSKIKFDLSSSNFSTLSTVGTMSDPDQSYYGSAFTSRPNNVISYFSLYLNTGNTTIVNNGIVRRSTANHELGHGMGIADITSGPVLAVMNIGRDRTKIYLPQQDDKNAVNTKYAF